MKKTFYSNGKLLITGEYLVLDGAKAFALPTKYGQNLIIEKGKGHKINWKSYNRDGSVWFEAIIPFSEIVEPNPIKENSVEKTLIAILHHAYLKAPTYIDNSTGYQISTELGFPKEWGLGTSSTLINNIAQWLEIDAFELLQSSFGGSGYDIACAQNNTGICYQLVSGKPKVEQVHFNPKFTDSIYFIYLNQKQNSKQAIENYKQIKNYNLKDSLFKIDQITTQVLNTETRTDLSEALENHEKIMSEILKTTRVKEHFFSDFEGTIKSLGAWGGDFVMVICEVNPSEYFASKGYHTIFEYKDLILP